MVRLNLALTFVVGVKLFVKLIGAVISLPVFLEVVVYPLKRQLGSDFISIVAAVVTIAAVLVRATS